MKRLTLFLSVLTVILMFFSCDKENGAEPENNVVSDPVVVTFQGHSCFQFVTPELLTVITDPVGNSVPQYYRPPASVIADLVTVSHNHADHTQTGTIQGDPVILGAADTTLTVGDVEVRGYLTQHGNWNGQAMGSNIIFVFMIGDIKIVHLGETGPFSDESIKNAISNADVMIAPTGETASLSFEEVIALAEETNARTLIPSHYSLTASNRYYGSSTVEEFVAALPQGTKVVYADTLAVRAGMEEQVVVLTPLWAKD